jgi:hypothetical protein
MADDEPPQQRWRHGTTYGYFKKKCRCTLCTIQGTEYSRRLVKRRMAAGELPPDDPRHGKNSTYVNWRCRCANCTKAHNDENLKLKAEQRARRK